MKLPPFKFIQYINSCAKGFSYADEHLYDTDLRERIIECGYIDKLNKLTPMGTDALDRYNKQRFFLESLALDVVNLLSKHGADRVPVPMCGYAIGVAKANNWLTENERGLLECTMTGLTTLSARRRKGETNEASNT